MYSGLCHSDVYLVLYAYTDDGIPFGHSDVEIVSCLVSKLQIVSFFIKAMLFLLILKYTLLHSTTHILMMESLSHTVDEIVSFLVSFFSYYNGWFSTVFFVWWCGGRVW
jgi:hypothetical protein